MPREWSGETAAILACGPSMSQTVADAVRGRCRVIAINNAVRLAPWADVLWFCDRRWYNEHQADVDAFGQRVVTLENYELQRPHLYHVHNYGRDGLHLDPPDGVMTGRNSGVQAINLAVLLGVTRILLCGYDMRFVDGRSHFHGGHRWPTGTGIYRNAMLPMFPPLVPILERLGVSVWNCTPDSALDCFPRVPLEEALNADRVLDPA